MQRGKKLSREDTHMLMAHAFGTLNQDSSCTPTLLTYKSTATEDEVLEMASVLLEAHRVSRGPVDPAGFNCLFLLKTGGSGAYAKLKPRSVPYSGSESMNQSVRCIS